MESNGLDMCLCQVLNSLSFQKKQRFTGFFDQLTENSALPAGMVKVKITNKILSGSLDDLWTLLLLV